MEIIKFEVNATKNYFNTNHLIFDIGSMIIKAENNKAYFNEKQLIVIINKIDNQLKNYATEVGFTSFDEGETFYTRLSDLDDNSQLVEFSNIFINNLSDLNEEELAQLDKELMEFSIKNLIDHALDTNDKELFMELTK